MRKIIFTIMSLGICGILQAQSVPVTGKWEFAVVTPFNTDKIVIDFRTDGNRLGGTIIRSEPPGQPPANLEGEILDDTITFTVKSPDGLRTIMIKGKINSDEIAFTREASGAAGQGPGMGFYGLDGPATVIATRVKR